MSDIYDYVHETFVDLVEILNQELTEAGTDGVEAAKKFAVSAFTGGYREKQLFGILINEMFGSGDMSIFDVIDGCFDAAHINDSVLETVVINDNGFITSRIKKSEEAKDDRDITIAELHRVIAELGGRIAQLEFRTGRNTVLGPQRLGIGQVNFPLNDGEG